MSGEGGRTSIEEEIDMRMESADKNAKLRRVDSLNLEAGRLSTTAHHPTKMGWRTTLTLAFQSLGIVYGDIGTSPLYVYATIFPDKIKHKDDILGVLSLMIYTIVLIPMVKYVFIVLWANDNGNGGAFALYSLICRHLNMSLIPNQQSEDTNLSTYKLQTPSSQLERRQKIKQKLEDSHFARILLVLLTILGTSMVIGDGILTPSISVLSAVSGVSKSLDQNIVVWIGVIILLLLFFAQRFGTDRVGFTFAPIILVWFFLIGVIGLYNLIKYDIGVLRAFNPIYIYDYFKRNGKQGWMSLGGVFLCITGSEAMFADLGHFNVKAIQISFSCVTFPAILAAYSGQAAFLRKFPEKVATTFYDSIPHPLYWPTFVVAVAAAVIASQAMISGAFTIISQALNLGCFPRVKVVHTSIKHQGQVYIPEINYMFMIACIVICLAFKTTEKISNAYGIAVIGDMFITTILVSLIMLVIWKKSLWRVILFFLVFGFTEMVYLSAQLTKFTAGGYLPIVLALFLTTMMGTWHYAQKERYIFELENKVSGEYLRDVMNGSDIKRLPGIGLMYSELVQGIPPIFRHLIASVPSIHSVVVFISFKAIPVSRVPTEERFLFRHVNPREHRIFRCVVRHGYSDVFGDAVEFESQLIQNLKAFIQQEFDEGITNEQIPQGLSQDGKASSSNAIIDGGEVEIKFIDDAFHEGVVYMLAEAEVVARPDSSIFNKIFVNYVYSFLRKNFRQSQNLMAIPRNRLLKVGMTYEI